MERGLHNEGALEREPVRGGNALVSERLQDGRKEAQGRQPGRESRRRRRSRLARERWLGAVSSYVISGAGRCGFREAKGRVCVGRRVWGVTMSDVAEKPGQMKTENGPLALVTQLSLLWVAW